MWVRHFSHLKKIGLYLLRAIAYVGISLGIILMTLISLLLLSNIPTIRERLINTSQEYLLSKGINVRVNGLKGFFPFRFSVQDFTYQDTTTHIQIKDASLSSTLDIKNARFLITQSNFQDVIITISPDNQATTEENDLSKELEGLFGIQRFLFVEHLRVKNFLVKTPYHYSITPYALFLDLENQGHLKINLLVSHPTMEDRISANVEVTKKTINNLDIKISISEKSPIGALLGLRDQFRLAVSQSKSLPNQADFELSLINLVEGKGKILFEDLRKKGIAITSHVLINQENVQLFEPKKEFDLSLTIRPVSQEKYALSGTLDSPNLHLSCEGRDVSLSHPFKLSYSMELKEGFRAPNGLKAEKTHMSGTLLIHKGLKKMDTKLNISAFSYHKLHIKEVSMEGNLEELSKQNYEATIKGLRFEVLNKPDFLEDQTVQIEAKGIISPSQVDIHSLKANSKDLGLELKGGIFLEQRTWDIRLSLLSKKNFKFLNHISLSNPACDLTIRLKETNLDRKDFEISGDITGVKQDLLRAKSAKNRERISIDTAFSLENDETLKVRFLNIQNNGMQYTFKGSTNIKTLMTEMSLDAAFSDLTISEEDLIQIKKGTLTALIKGNPNSLEASSRLNIEGSIKGNPYEIHTSPLTVALNGEQIESSAEIKGLFSETPFDLRAKYNTKSFKSWILNVNGDAAQNPLVASFACKEKSCDGIMDISIQDLSPISSLLVGPIKASGKASIQVNISQNSNRIAIKTNLNDLSFNQFEATHINLDAIITDLNSRHLELSCKIGDLKASKEYLGGLEISAKSDQHGYFVNIHSKGGDFVQRLGTQFYYLPDGNAHVFDISLFELSLGGETFFLKSPGKIEVEKSRIALNNLQFDFDKAIIKLSGSLDQKDSNLNLSWHGLYLRQFRQFLGYEINGSCSGNFILTGIGSNPDIQGEVNFDGLSISQMQYMPSYTGNLLVNLSNHRLNSRFKLMQDKAQVLLVEADIPVRMTLFPFFAEYDAQSIGHLYVGSDVDIEMLGLSEILPGKNMRGKLKVNADLKLQNKVYDMKGRLEVNDFEFVNIRDGMFLKDSSLAATLSKDKLVIEQLRVKDHQKGLIEGKGEIQLAHEGLFLVSMAFNLQGFRPISQKGIEMKLSGNTFLVGGMDQLLLKGDLNIDSLVIDIDQLRAGGPKELNVVEIRYPGEIRYRLPATPKDPLERLKLDLNVRSPKTAKLKGKDLDSLWKGNLRIKGTASAPEISGTMELEKGRYMLLSKPFPFSSGKIYFEGQNPPRPYVTARAEAGKSGSKAFADISGPLDDLKLTLSSESDVPPGEALSRVLFGKSLSSLSPMQGIRIAELLSGGKEKMPLFNIMSLPEKLFRLDSLAVDEESPEKGKLVKAGKFLNDRIYLELDWGLEAEKGRVRVNMELTPHIELQTQMGEKGAGAEINFRWDY